MPDLPSVLVVEDEPSENQFLTMTVRGLGHQAESCFDGQAAITWLQEHRPSLVFLDALLPKADGFAVLQEVRRLYPDVPVYMMSGVYKKKSYKDDAVGKLGATAYLHKPLGVMQVWEILERNLPPVPASEVGRDSPGVPFWRRPLPVVVADLSLAQKTGLLFVRGNGGSAMLFFEDGKLIFGRCNDPQLRLDRVLTQLGKLKREQLPRVAELAAQSRGRLGETLVAEKLITQEDLALALNMQQRNHVTNPLTWSEGSCWFYPTDAPRNETFKMQLDVPALVFWACRHLEVDENLVRFLGRPERKVRCRASGASLAKPYGLSPEEAGFVDLLDGTRSIAQLRAIGRMMQIDAERILTALLALQFAELGPEPEQKAQLTPLFGSSVPVAGDLSKFSPALLLVSMAFSRKTGVLQLETRGDGAAVNRAVHFVDGDIAFATSNDPADRIGQVLLRVGLLTKDQLQEALAVSTANPGVALGRILVGMKLLGPDALHAGLVHQAQQVITGMVGWKSGTFQFQENEGPARDVVPLGLDTRQALMTALRTCPFTDIASRLPSPETRLRSTMTAHQLAADLPLTMLESRLRQEADGSRTVQEIATSTPEGPEAALRAIFTLTSIGLVEGFLLPLGAAPPPPRAQPLAVDPLAPPAPGMLALDDGAAASPARFEMPLLGADPSMTGETTLERTRRAKVQAADESFGGGEEESTSWEQTADDVAAKVAAATPRVTLEDALMQSMASGAATPAAAPAHGFAEDWSTPAEASFADLGDAPSPAAAPLEDWSSSDEGSFAGLDEAAGPADLGGFSLDALASELGEALPLDSGGFLDASPPPSRGGTAVATRPLTAAQVEALEAFLTCLADWLRTCPEAVPESVRALLPPDVRANYGL